jgi:hypothetical protein
VTQLSRSVAAELYSRYKRTWSEPWPEDRAFLAILWFEAKSHLGVSPQTKKHGPAIKALTLTLMKENTE